MYFHSEKNITKSLKFNRLLFLVAATKFLEKNFVKNDFENQAVFNFFLQKSVLCTRSHSEENRQFAIAQNEVTSNQPTTTWLLIGEVLFVELSCGRVLKVQPNYVFWKYLSLWRLLLGQPVVQFSQSSYKFNLTLQFMKW